MNRVPLRLPAVAAMLSLAACAADPSRQLLAPTNAVGLPDSETTPAVGPAAGVRGSNVGPRLVLRATPALDTSTSPPTLRGTAPLAVHFNLCGSDDADTGDSLNWQFHFGDSGAPPFGPDGVFRPDFDHQCRVDHTYGEGSWTATLSVTDKHLEDQGRGEPRALARTTTQVRIVATAKEPPPTPPGSPSGPGGPTSNRPPIANPDAFEGNEGITCLAIDWRANDSDPDGDPLSITVTVQPVNGELFEGPSAGTFCYRPFKRFFHGTDEFKYFVSDGRGGVSAPTTVSIVIKNIE